MQRNLAAYEATIPVLKVIRAIAQNEDERVQIYENTVVRHEVAGSRIVEIIEKF